MRTHIRMNVAKKSEDVNEENNISYNDDSRKLI